MKENNKMNLENQDKKNQKKWILLILLLIALIIGGFLFFFSNNSSEFDENAHNYNDPVKKGPNWTAGQLVFPGFGEVSVNADDKEIPIILGNSKINEAYFKYKVVVEQEGKEVTILNTKLIRPGEAITEIPTEKINMKEGTYLMKITVNAYSLKNSKAPLNSSTVDAKLVIKD